MAKGQNFHYELSRKSAEKRQIHAFNSKQKKTVFASIKKKEKEIDTAKLFYNDSFINTLRDDLEKLNKIAQGIKNQITNFNKDIPEKSEENIIPKSGEELERKMFNALIAAYDVKSEEGEDIFNIEPTTEIDEKGNEIKAFKVSVNKKFKGGEYDASMTDNHFAALYGPINDMIDNARGSKDTKQLRQDIVNEIKEDVDEYYNILSLRSSKDENGVVTIREVPESKEIIDDLFEKLSARNLAGLAPSEEESNNKNLNIDINTEGEELVASKKFNLKKHAAKLYDSIREVPKEKINGRYQELHRKAVPEYEEAYTPEKDFIENVMDKYYREYIGDDGEYEGGYINDRFVVHHNSEGNSNHIKSNERSGPDRIESYSTERRLEEMRNANERGYYKYSDEKGGSKTEQQNRKTLASTEVTKENGLYKVRYGDKITYLDTKAQLDTFKRIVLDTNNSITKKKVAIAENIDTEPTDQFDTEDQIRIMVNEYLHERDPNKLNEIQQLLYSFYLNNANKAATLERELLEETDNDPELKKIFLAAASTTGGEGPVDDLDVGYFE